MITSLAARWTSRLASIAIVLGAIVLGVSGAAGAQGAQPAPTAIDPEAACAALSGVVVPARQIGLPTSGARVVSATFSTDSPPPPPIRFNR